MSRPYGKSLKASGLVLAVEGAGEHAATGRDAFEIWMDRGSFLIVCEGTPYTPNEELFSLKGVK